jgi:hypothetical protein
LSVKLGVQTKAVLASCLMAFLAAPRAARAGFFGRSRLASLWAAAPVPVNGDDEDWSDKSSFEEDGFAVFAMNDAKDLYLLVTGHTRESRDQLSGESHQDLSLWFVAADGKTRRWGARIPFSHRSPLTSALRDRAGLDPEPEQLQYQGAEVSTSTLPGDVVDRLAAAGRRPIWELKIPLKRLEPSAEGAVAVDFVVSAPPGGAKRQAAPKTARVESPTDGADSGPARGHGPKRGADSASHPEDLVWDAQSYALSVRLAPDPSLPPR